MNPVLKRCGCFLNELSVQVAIAQEMSAQSSFEFSPGNATDSVDLTDKNKSITVEVKVGEFSKSAKAQLLYGSFIDKSSPSRVKDDYQIVKLLCGATETFISFYRPPSIENIKHFFQVVNEEHGGLWPSPSLVGTKAKVNNLAARIMDDLYIDSLHWDVLAKFDKTQKPLDRYINAALDYDSSHNIYPLSSHNIVHWMSELCSKSVKTHKGKVTAELFNRVNISELMKYATWKSDNPGIKIDIDIDHMKNKAYAHPQGTLSPLFELYNRCEIALTPQQLSYLRKFYVTEDEVVKITRTLDVLQGVMDKQLKAGIGGRVNFGRFYTKPDGVVIQDQLLTKNLGKLQEWFIIDPFVGAGSLQFGELCESEGLLTDIDEEALGLSHKFLDVEGSQGNCKFKVITEGVNFLDKSIDEWINWLKYKHGYDLMQKVAGKKVLVLANPPFGFTGSHKGENVQTFHPSCAVAGTSDLIQPSVVQMINLSQKLCDVAKEVNFCTYSRLRWMTGSPKMKALAEFVESRVEFMDATLLYGDYFNETNVDYVAVSLYKVKDAQPKKMIDIRLGDIEIKKLDTSKWVVWSLSPKNLYLKNRDRRHRDCWLPDGRFRYDGSIHFGIDPSYYNYVPIAPKSYSEFSASTPDNHCNFVHPEALHDHVPKSINGYPTELLVPLFHIAQATLATYWLVPNYLTGPGNLLSPTLDNWTPEVMKVCALKAFMTMFLEQGDSGLGYNWCESKVEYRKLPNGKVKFKFDYVDYHGNFISYADDVERLVKEHCPDELTDFDGHIIKRDELWNIIRSRIKTNSDCMPMDEYIQFKPYILNSLHQAVKDLGIFDALWRYS